MHYGLDMLAIVSGETFTADAAKTEDATDPFLWTEVTGGVTFDGTVLTEAHAEQLTVDTGLEAFYGDDNVSIQLTETMGLTNLVVNAIRTDVPVLKFIQAV